MMGDERVAEGQIQDVEIPQDAMARASPIEHMYLSGKQVIGARRIGWAWLMTFSSSSESL